MASRRFLFGVFTLFFAIGLGLIGVGAKVTLDARASQTWPSSSGEVLHSKVESRQETRSRRTPRGVRHPRTVTLHRPLVQYRYQVEGTPHIGTRISFYDAASDRAELARAVVARYPRGTAVTVFYDPLDPTRSVLEPGEAEWLPIPTLIGLAFVGVSAVASLLVHIAWRRL